MHHHLSLRGKLIIMLSVMSSLFLVALDQTIIATALGKIVEEFNAFESLSWIVTAYLLTTTVTVPIAGKLSDLYGRRALLLIGVSVFLAGSLFSGMSGSINQLIFARAIQGIGGGIITANAFTIIGDLFAARERGKWQGLIGAVFGLSSVVGPLLGGWLTDGHNILGLTTNWRWTFYINVPVAIIALIMLLIFCPPLRHDKRPSVDYAGAALLTLALATLVLAVDNTAEIFKPLLDNTGMSIVTLRIIMFSIVTLAVSAFIWVENRSKEPILPLILFKNRNFVLITGIASLFGGAFMGAILYLTQFNQQAFGASPTQSGLMLLPMVAGLMFSSITSGQIISKTGKYKIFMQVGIVTATIMIGIMTTLTPQSSYVFEAIIMALMGVGLGVVMPVMTLVVQNEFKHHELGVATSSTQLFRSLGSTIGIAIFGAVLTAGLVSQIHISKMLKHPYVAAISQSDTVKRVGSLNDVNTYLSLNMPDVKKLIKDEYISHLNSLPENEREVRTQQFISQQNDFSNQVSGAFSESLSNIFKISTILMATASVLVFAIKENPLKKALPNDAPGLTDD